MSFTALELVAAATTEDDGSGVAGPIFIFVFIAIAAAISTAFFTRRNRKAKEDAVGASASGGAVEALAVVLAPAPPFPEALAQVRAALADTGPEPKITRYSSPVLVVGTDSIIVRDKKLGTLVTIAASDIVKLEARTAQITPKGTFVARNYPAVWVTVRRGAAEASVPLVPVVGSYEKISDAQAQALAAEIATRIGLGTKPTA